MAEAVRLLNNLTLADHALRAAIQLERFRIGLSADLEVVGALKEALDGPRTESLDVIIAEVAASAAVEGAGGDVAAVKDRLQKFADNPDATSVPSLVQFCIGLRRQLADEAALRDLLVFRSSRSGRSLAASRLAVH